MRFPDAVIVAHRGYAFRYPENTLEAFQAAVDAGAKWVEVDVQLRDGVPVLAHDAGVPGETLAEFAAWLEARSDVTALVDLKSESLTEYGRAPVVAAVMETMRGNWHPISFDSRALELAVEAGSRAPGWVVCRFEEDILTRADGLGARWLITNQIFMPKRLPAGSWEWMVYEIENREQAENAIARGARWLETMRVGELIEAMQ
jgi:glycerophosphoryl diester phosphodiesterase